ncbi:MAG: hypothetical protein sL5_07380 [Candidatus Mesenet longicola]|uniref:Uncharacterized protein n=1 Tax=Candidatus Mesenet longicola TaxID=1892558 RepID=A0A8J3HV87_9RICK|nr:MAG: hypothetical protein sGL2_07760 [Candidatus Mesenet longicola]GHM59745.1 MAG: hypothetical protein sL5_07380 [Candidatus Mesenet longicola]
MCSYFSNTIEKTSSNKNSGADILRNPAYREKYIERVTEAQKNSSDLVQYYDGNIVVIKDKPTLYTYSWDPKKMDFERTKKGKEE